MSDTLIIDVVARDPGEAETATKKETEKERGRRITALLSDLFDRPDGKAWRVKVDEGSMKVQQKLINDGVHAGWFDLENNHRFGKVPDLFRECYQTLDLFGSQSPPDEPSQVTQLRTEARREVEMFEFRMGSDEPDRGFRRPPSSNDQDAEFELMQTFRNLKTEATKLSRNQSWKDLFKAVGNATVDNINQLI